jgi:D-alanine-D-alanine ligase
MNSKLHVGIVYTKVSCDLMPRHDNSQEYVDTSLSEYESGIDTIQSALEESDYKVTKFGIKKDLHELVSYITVNKPDVIFNLCESFDNNSMNEMHIAGIFELLKVPYTGNKALTLGNLLRKAEVKSILKRTGFCTPKFQIVFDCSNFEIDNTLNFPLIVKPSREDASTGINNLSVVHSIEDVKKQVQFVYDLVKQPILLEEYIEGREINVAILGNKEPEVLPMSEIDFAQLPKHLPKIVTYNAKWLTDSVEYKGTNAICPANIEQKIAKNLKNIALDVYSMFDCSGYARVDFRLDSNNIPYILEINPNPDISMDAGFYRAAKNYGYSYADMLKKIVEFGLKNNDIYY